MTARQLIDHAREVANMPATEFSDESVMWFVLEALTSIADADDTLAEFVELRTHELSNHRITRSVLNE